MLSNVNDKKKDEIKLEAIDDIYFKENHMETQLHFNRFYLKSAAKLSNFKKLHLHLK